MYPESNETLEYEIEKARKEISLLSEMLKEKIEHWNRLFDKLSKKCSKEIESIKRKVEEATSAR